MNKEIIIQYMSLAERNDNQIKKIRVNKDVMANEGDVVLIRHIGKGVFLGQVLEFDEDVRLSEGYIAIDKVNVSKYNKMLLKEKRIKELEAEMEDKMAQLEEIRKYEMYAAMDKGFSDLLEEYKKWNSQEI